MGHKNIRYAVEDRGAAITIDRPELRNAMTRAFLEKRAPQFIGR